MKTETNFFSVIYCKGSATYLAISRLHRRVNELRSLLDVTQRKLVVTDVSGQLSVPLPTFRDNYRSHLQGSSTRRRIP